MVDAAGGGGGVGGPGGGGAWAVRPGRGSEGRGSFGRGGGHPDRSLALDAQFRSPGRGAPEGGARCVALGRCAHLSESQRPLAKW